MILTRFPIIKVVLKPLSSLNRFEANDRIGAFEIQVLSNIQGRPNQQKILHSKLTEKRWPDPEHIVDQLIEHLPKATLRIKIFEENNAENYIDNLTVTLTPVRKLAQ
mmetsp:Transcript_29367/g.5306  ORF Transcript_29367/g.5306 Transcript_29367/m.5306 type:complete len:107 (+) Transcript_29367:364-684(+)